MLAPGVCWVMWVEGSRPGWVEGSSPADARKKSMSSFGSDWSSASHDLMPDQPSKAVRADETAAAVFMTGTPATVVSIG